MAHFLFTPLYGLNLRLQEPIQTVHIQDNRKIRMISMVRIIRNRTLRAHYNMIVWISIAFGLVQTYTIIYLKNVDSIVNPGLFFTFYGVGCIASNWILCPLSDRWGRKRIVLPSILMMGMGVHALSWVHLNGVSYYLGSLLIGLGHAGSMSSLIVWIIDDAPKSFRTSSLAVQDNAEDIGIAIGALCSGAILPTVGLRFLFFSSGLLLSVYAFIAIIRVLLVRRNAVNSRIGSTELANTFVQGVKSKIVCNFLGSTFNLCEAA